MVPIVAMQQSCKDRGHFVVSEEKCAVTEEKLKKGMLYAKYVKIQFGGAVSGICSSQHVGTVSQAGLCLSNGLLVS